MSEYQGHGSGDLFPGHVLIEKLMDVNEALGGKSGVLGSRASRGVSLPPASAGCRRPRVRRLVLAAGFDGRVGRLVLAAAFGAVLVSSTDAVSALAADSSVSSRFRPRVPASLLNSTLK